MQGISEQNSTNVDGTSYEEFLSHEDVNSMLLPCSHISSCSSLQGNNDIDGDRRANTTRTRPINAMSQQKSRKQALFYESEETSDK